MASDGLWDVMSNQEAVTLAKKCLGSARSRGSTRQVGGGWGGFWRQQVGGHCSVVCRNLVGTGNAGLAGRLPCSGSFEGSLNLHCNGLRPFGFSRRSRPRHHLLLLPSLECPLSLAPATTCRVRRGWLPLC